MKKPTFPNHRSTRTPGLLLVVAGCVTATMYAQEPAALAPAKAGQPPAAVTPAVEPGATPAPAISAAPAALAVDAALPVLPPPPTAAVPQPPLPTPAVPAAPAIPGAGLPPGPSIPAAPSAGAGAPSAGAGAPVGPAQARASNRIQTTAPRKRAQRVARTAIEEELAGDPQSTVRGYEAIIDEFDRQREDAAQAIFRLAEALRKLGRIEEARVQYSRILREFVDFPELARLSQQQLSQNAANQFPTGATIPPQPASPEEQSLLKEELGLLEEQLARTKDLIKQGIASEASIFPVQRDILHLKQQLARLAVATRNVAGAAETSSNASPARSVPKTPFARGEGSTAASSNTRPGVAVLGSISQPGVVDFRPGMKICDAITERGGPDRKGDASRVRLTRAGESRDLDLSDVASQPENNVELEAGDSIIVLPSPGSKKSSTTDATTSPATDPSPTTPARR